MTTHVNHICCVQIVNRSVRTRPMPQHCASAPPTSSDHPRQPRSPSAELLAVPHCTNRHMKTVGVCQHMNAATARMSMPRVKPQVDRPHARSLAVLRRFVPSPPTERIANRNHEPKNRKNWITSSQTVTLLPRLTGLAASGLSSGPHSGSCSVTESCAPPLLTEVAHHQGGSPTPVPGLLDTWPGPPGPASERLISSLVSLASN